MKILFYSSFFAPSVGGIEKIAEMLCREFTDLDHEVVLATQTPGGGDFPFEVRRQPSVGEMARLLRWCDVHLQANVSLKAAWAWLLAPRKMLYMHQNVYQRDDGTQRMLDRLKTALARATPSIANSAYTAARTGAAEVILNPYDDEVFGPPTAWEEKDYELVFLGRLVSQKGCDTLIEALALLAGRKHHADLTIIGDGPDRRMLERQVKACGLTDKVRFAGVLQGKPLASELARHRVLVVPSRYEEPFGIVALEGLASGCLPVVSERGGLTDAIGRHGLTFANGDAAALADRLAHVLCNLDEARALLEGVEVHLERYRARAVADRYLELFKQHVGGKD